MVHRTPSGLGTYAAHLARALTARDAVNAYVVIRSSDSPSPIVPGERVHEVTLPGDLDTPRNLVRGRDITRLGLDVYHSLHHFLPPGLGVPRVVITLHDLIWIEHAGLIVDGRVFGAAARVATHLFARGAMRYALRRADRVIAISDYSRSRALARYHLEPSHVVVVPHGVDRDRFRPSAASSSLPDKAPYFLCVGNTRPYKDIPTALRAFAMCIRERSNLRLVVVGRGDSTAGLQSLAHALRIEHAVRFAGLVSDADLLTLLQEAIALVFPSVVEGFGLPVLEAMAAGCPVIASRAPAIGDVAGGAALLCAPEVPDEFATAMMRLLEDRELRQDLRRKGCVRAAQFSWDRSAEQTLAVYEQLLER